MRRFGALRVTRHAILLTKGRQILATGQEFVHIRLVARIEDDCISRRIKDPMDRQCGFDDTQVWSEVTAGLGNGVDQV